MPCEGGCRAGRRHGRVGLRGRATETVPGPLFDLVSMQYPALPKAAGEAVVRTLLDTVRPGGLLLAVYHDLDDEQREHTSPFFRRGARAKSG